MYLFVFKNNIACCKNSKQASKVDPVFDSAYQLWFEEVTDFLRWRKIAFETQGNSGPRTLRLNELGSRLRANTVGDNARQYLFQWISIAIHTANAACVLGKLSRSEKKLDEVVFL